MNIRRPPAGSGRCPWCRRVGLFVALTFALLAAGGPRLRADTAVTEADYQTLRRLEYAEALCKTRKMWARGDAEKIAAAEAGLKKTWQESGWTRAHLDEVSDALGVVTGAIRSLKNGESTQADFDATVTESDPVTIATARAHFDEMENARDADKAEKQVRDELEEERRGEAPTAAQLEGTWVFDLDATIDVMAELFPIPDRAKFKADMAAKIGNMSYTFGPGDRVVSRATGLDGKERADTGAYRLDGHTIFFKSPGSKSEQHLEIGIRHGKLQMGTGFGVVVYSRK